MIMWISGLGDWTIAVQIGWFMGGAEKQIVFVSGG
jgi:hypothetical protein